MADMTDVMEAISRAHDFIDKCRPSDEEMASLVIENPEFSDLWHAFSIWIFVVELSGLDDAAIHALLDLVRVTYWLGGERKVNENLDVFEEHIGGGDEKV